jgi:hypothetical protein
MQRHQRRLQQLQLNNTVSVFSIKSWPPYGGQLFFRFQIGKQTTIQLLSWFPSTTPSAWNATEQTHSTVVSGNIASILDNPDWLFPANPLPCFHCHEDHCVKILNS